MRQQFMFKLDQSPSGRGLRCDSSGLFLGGNALLQRDHRGNFEALPVAKLQKVLGCAYGHETNWDSRVRSVKLVANALNKGEMARAMMTAVLMRLPDPSDPVRVAHADRVLSKAGFDADEPRNERGRWTNGGRNAGSNGGQRDVGIQLADSGMSDAIDDLVAEAAARAAASPQ